MPREHTDYRNNLAILNDRFPDHDMLTIEEAMLVWGCKSVNTIKKLIPFVNRRVSKATLARLMCG